MIANISIYCSFFKHVDQASRLSDGAIIGITLALLLPLIVSLVACLFIVLIRNMHRKSRLFNLSDVSLEYSMIRDGFTHILHFVVAVVCCCLNIITSTVARAWCASKLISCQCYYSWYWELLS